jgi:cytochrome c oxidase cbb3-type subunit III
VIFGPGRSRQIRLSIAFAVSLFVFCFTLAAQQLEQDYQRFQIDRGAALYASNCIECHADGTGVPGVNLRTGQFPHGSTDQDLISAIHNGIPGTMMPAHDFAAPDLSALVAYIRSLANDETGPVKLGDPAKGRVLFQQNSCFNCHRVGTEGSHTALNLSDAGTLHPPSFLLRALLNPNTVLAEQPGNRLVRAVTANGKVVSGRRLNEDTYTVQIIDSQENLVSLDKSTLRSLTIVEQSPMPSLKDKLTPEQLSDLVAYLASLKDTGTQTAAQYGAPPGVGSGFAAGRGGRGGRGGAPGGGGGDPGGGQPQPASPETPRSPVQNQAAGANQ